MYFTVVLKTDQKALNCVLLNGWITRLYELQVNRAVLKTYLIDPVN